MKVNILGDVWTVKYGDVNGGSFTFEGKKITIGDDLIDKDEILSHEVFEILSCYMKCRYLRNDSLPYIFLSHPEISLMTEGIHKFYMNKDNMKVMRELSKI